MTQVCVHFVKFITNVPFLCVYMKSKYEQKPSQGKTVSAWAFWLPRLGLAGRRVLGRPAVSFSRVQHPTPEHQSTSLQAQRKFAVVNDPGI